MTYNVFGGTHVKPYSTTCTNVCYESIFIYLFIMNIVQSTHISMSHIKLLKVNIV